MPTYSNRGPTVGQIRDVVREELRPVMSALGQLAEGQRVLLEDVAEIKQTVRKHKERITAVERSA